jgi:ankyrin repeat protein
MAIRRRLFLAIKNRKYFKVQELSKKIDLNIIYLHQGKYCLPLHEAIKKGDWKIVALLLENGADINMYNNNRNAMDVLLNVHLHFEMNIVDVNMINYTAKLSAEKILRFRSKKIYNKCTTNKTVNLVIILELLLQYGLDLNYNNSCYLKKALDYDLYTFAHYMIHKGALITLVRSDTTNGENLLNYLDDIKRNVMHY